MPQAIPLIATFAATLGSGVVASTAIFYGVSAALYLGVSIGLSFLSQALMGKPSAPKPEDVQTSLKQPAQPRARHYGRVKVSGPWVFGDSKAGTLYKVLALGQGPIAAIEEYWIDDRKALLDAAGNTTNILAGYVNIQTRLGATPETAYPAMTANFPQWTSAHRGDGVVSLFARQFPVGQEYFLSMFPNGVNTSYRVVLRGAELKSPYSGTVSWTDNAAMVILDYMTHADGMRLPLAIFNTPLALASWQLGTSRASENIPIKAGGTEDRYRLWGTYYLNERPADVLGRMLQCCDGRLYPTSDGGLALDIGAWAEPVVVLDETSIVGFSDLSRGKDILTTANTVRATYMDPSQDYQTTDADPWVDNADVSERGEIETDIEFIMSPSHSQTRRLMKFAAYRAKPLWIGTFQTNLAGLAALGERLVRIRYPLFGLDEVVEVQNLLMIVGEGNILQGITLEVQSMPQAAYQWDISQEGTEPVSSGTDVDHTVPVPTGLAAAIISGTPPYAKLTWAAAPTASLIPEAQGKRTADTDWITVAVARGATTAQSFALTTGQQYEFQVRYRGGAWSASVTVTA